VLRDRQELAGDGIVIVVAVVNHRTGQIMHLPDIISRGFVYMKDQQELIQLSRKKVADILKKGDPSVSRDIGDIKDVVRDELGEYLYHKTQLRPMVLPIIVEV
jgi:ribonuclease J